MVTHKAPFLVWLEYIISVLMVIVTGVAGVFVNAYFYGDDPNVWKRVLIMLLALIFTVLFLLTVFNELGGEEVWVEELRKLLHLVG